jgi:hypothetical protein
VATIFPNHSATEQLEVDAEIKRIAKLLGRGHVEFDYLRSVPSVELRQLRDQVTVTLFDNQAVMARMAAATKIMPAGVIAGIAEKVFGPMLAARIAGLVEPDKAVDIACRLSTPFLADVAVEIDPRRVAAILAKIPPATVADVTKLLVEREEWVSMGMFLGYLPPAAVAAAMSSADAHGLLHIALVLDEKPRLAGVFDFAPPATLAQVSAAAEAEGLSEQLQALSSYLTPEQLAQVQG